MKKEILAVLCIAVLSAACGSDGGKQVVSADDVPEGVGQDLDLSSTSDSSSSFESNAESNAESVVKSILNNVGSTFDSVDSSSSSTGSSTTTNSTTSSLESAAKLLTKSSSTSNETYQFCSKGSYVETIKKTIKGYSGSATFEGSINTTKTSDDQATATVDINGAFTDFVYYSPAKGKNYKLTGSAHMDGEAHITKGMKQICDAVLSNSSLYDDIDASSDMYEHVSGELSISGDAGAAIAFDLTTTLAVSNDSKTSSFDYSVSGTASLKSGGKTVSCTIGKKGDIEDSDMVVDCK